MLTLSGLLQHHAAYRGHYPALHFEGKTWTFAEFNDFVNELANALIGSRLVKGDRFATILPNCVELMAAYWAAAVSGLVIVPCSTMLQPNGLRTLLGDSGAKLVLFDHQQMQNIDELKSELPALIDANRILLHCDETTSYTQYDTFIKRRPAPLISIETINISGSDIFNIMYSSGTTGLPKGIIHTHEIRSLYGILFASAWRMTPESIVLHAGAIVFNGAMLDLMPWMYLGCQYILNAKFDAEEVLEQIERYHVTHMVMVPAQIIALLNSPKFDATKLRSIEMIHNVGAPLHLNYKEMINELLPNRYYELYGVTEGFMTILDRTESVTKQRSVGKPMSFTEIVILDDAGIPCPFNTIGEICGKGPLVMPAYHNKPELTEKAFTNGWLRSGDLGYQDEDGYIYLVDRKKDMIISGGVNVYPRDIEEVIVQHPAVQEVAVIGIPSEKWGEVPVAVVTTINAVESGEIIHWVNARVDAKFQRIADVVILDDFPRNAAGKILKRELRQSFKSN